MYKKKILIILLIVIHASVTICIKINNNNSVYYDNNFTEYDTSNSFAEVLGYDVNHKHTERLDDLISKSELVLIVNFESYEQPYNDKTFANIKIKKVLKGNKVSKGMSIKMFDDIGFAYVDSEFGLEKYIQVHNIYYPMYKGNDYIIFLNEDNENDGFYRQSTKFYSRYNLDDPVSCKTSFELPQQKCDTFEIDYNMFQENAKSEKNYKLIFNYREKIYYQIINEYLKGEDTNEN